MFDKHIIHNYKLTKDLRRAH